MTDLTYVVYGRWDDVEWRLAAAKPVSQRTDAEREMFRNGPRLHPWGSLARSINDPDGTCLIFPNEEAATAYAAARAAAEATPPVKAEEPSSAPEPVAFVDPFHADPEPEAASDHPSEASE